MYIHTMLRILSNCSVRQVSSTLYIVTFNKTRVNILKMYYFTDRLHFRDNQWPLSELNWIFSGIVDKFNLADNDSLCKQILLK